MGLAGKIAKPLGGGLARGLSFAPGLSLRAQVIDALFGSGEGGTYIEAADDSSSFQERTGASATTPALANDPTGTILDLSGNTNHCTATDDARRFLRKQSGGIWFWESDGADDFLVNPNTHVSVMSTVLALEYLSGRMIYGGRATEEERRYYDQRSGDLTFGYGTESSGEGTVIQSPAPSGFFVLTVNETATEITFRVNGLEVKTVTKSGTVGTSTSYISEFNNEGAPINQPASIKLCALAESNKTLTANDIDLVERRFSELCGVSLP